MFDSHGIALLKGALAYVLGSIESIKHWSIIENITHQHPLHPFVSLKRWGMLVSYHTIQEMRILYQLLTTALLSSWLHGSFECGPLFPLAARKLREIDSPLLSSVQDFIQFFFMPILTQNLNYFSLFIFHFSIFLSLHVMCVFENHLQLFLLWDQIWEKKTKKNKLQNVFLKEEESNPSLLQRSFVTLIIYKTMEETHIYPTFTMDLPLLKMLSTQPCVVSIQPWALEIVIIHFTHEQSKKKI